MAPVCSSTIAKKKFLVMGFINLYLLRKSPLRRPKPRPGKNEFIIIEAGAAAAAERKMMDYLMTFCIILSEQMRNHSC